VLKEDIKVHANLDWMVGMAKILRFEIHMEKLTIASMLREETMYGIRKINTLSMTIEMTTSRICHL
jgi:hypothetical protein